MLNPGPDRSLQITRRFEAAPERVFDAWLDPAKMRQWLFAMPGDEGWHGETEARVGGQWAITSRRGGMDCTATGDYLEIDRPRRLVVSWGCPSDADAPEKHDRVTFDIAEDQGVVRLTVMNENVEPGSGSAEAWPKVLCGLKSLLETGEALPPFWAREGSDWRNLRFA